MEITDELIYKLEKLAKLKLSTEEHEIIKKDLGKILEMIDKIQDVDTSEVSALQYVTDTVNSIREDVAENEISNEEALRNAPETRDSYFTVPKVIDL